MSAPPVTTEPTALTWLEGLPPDLHTMAERLFEVAIAEGHGDPRQICRQVWLVLCEHIPQAQANGDEEQAIRLLQIRNRLNDARDEAIAFAAAYLGRADGRTPTAPPRLGNKDATWASESEFEEALEAHFLQAGCIVHRQAWCNVYCDSGDKTAGRRRADLHVQLPVAIGGWLSCFVVELKLDTGAGDLLQGMGQAVAYMHGFDWRLGPDRHDKRRLPRPDLSLFTTPKILARAPEDNLLLLERYLWNNGVALMLWHGGKDPGTQFELIEKTHLLTGRWRT